MPHGFERRLRVAAILRAELAPLLAACERAAIPTVTDIDVARDLSVATVRIAVLAGDPKQAAARLDARRGELRAQLSKRVRMRKVPQLQFVCTGLGQDGKR